MLARSDSPPEAVLTRRQVLSYIEQMTLELAELAARDGHRELAASLSIVAIQAGGDRRRAAPDH